MPDSVTPLPSKTERLARKIKLGLQQIAKSGRDWIEGHIEVAEAITEARADLSDRDFGAWFDVEFPQIGKDERAAYAAMGEDSARLRGVLEKTKRKSIQLIYRNEWMVRNTTNHRSENVKQETKIEKAREIVRPIVERGDKVSRDLAKNLGISSGTLRLAEQFELGRMVERSELKAPEKKLDALKQKIQAEVEAEFQRRVDEGVAKALADRNAEDAELIEKCREWQSRHFSRERLPFTNEEYKLVLAALHPDVTNHARRVEAFTLFKRKEALLRAFDEKDWHKIKGIKPLPETVADLMAARKSRRNRASS